MGGERRRTRSSKRKVISHSGLVFLVKRLLIFSAIGKFYLYIEVDPFAHCILYFTGRLRHNSEQEETKETDKEDVELPLIDLDTIVTATNNFSINNKLGEGGFGPVYKMNYDVNFTNSLDFNDKS